MFELKAELIENVLGEQIMGYLGEPSISEIIVNSNGDLLIEDERSKRVVGKTNPMDIAHAAGLFAEHRGVLLNEKTPTLCMALPDRAPFCGARMQALMPPVVKAPSLTIRKHTIDAITLESFVEDGVMNETVFDLLSQALKDRQNIVISGQPKAGKTTLTRALLNHMPSVIDPRERILVLEHTPELRVHMEDVEYLMTSNTVSMRNLVRCATTMRPDRIIVGEVSDGSALDLLKSWNIGCPGGITTLHANSSQDALQRLIDLACENDIPPPINLINTTINLIVQIKKCARSKAGRVVNEVSELTGFNHKYQQFTFNQLYKEQP